MGNVPWFDQSSQQRTRGNKKTSRGKEYVIRTDFGCLQTVSWSSAHRFVRTNCCSILLRYGRWIADTLHKRITRHWTQGPAISRRPPLTLAASAGISDIKERLAKGDNVGTATVHRCYIDRLNNLDYWTGKSEKSKRDVFSIMQNRGSRFTIR